MSINGADCVNELNLYQAGSCVTTLLASLESCFLFAMQRETFEELEAVQGLDLMTDCLPSHYRKFSDAKVSDDSYLLCLVQVNFRNSQASIKCFHLFDNLNLKDSLIG